jgi:hypothetical protein
MPCGWHCGMKLTATEIRQHFVLCQKRPKISAVKRSCFRGRRHRVNTRYVPPRTQASTLRGRQGDIVRRLPDAQNAAAFCGLSETRTWIAPQVAFGSEHGIDSIGT